MRLIVVRRQKQLTVPEQTLTMDRLPQLSGKATKAKASGAQTVLSTYNTRKLTATYWLAIHVHVRVNLWTL